ADHADRLCARDPGQAVEHAGIEIDALVFIKAGEPDGSQRVFIDAAVEMDLLDPVDDQEAGIAQHGAGQRNLHGDQKGGETMLAQGGEYGSDLHMASTCMETTVQMSLAMNGRFLAQGQRTKAS